MKLVDRRRLEALLETHGFELSWDCPYPIRELDFVRPSPLAGLFEHVLVEGHLPDRTQILCDPLTR